MDDPSAASEAAALTGEPGAHAAVSARVGGGLAGLAGVATPALFRVAAIIGVVEVAARQWAVAKAKNGQRSPRSDESARSGRAITDQAGRTTIAENRTSARRACNTLVTPATEGVAFV